MLIGWFCTTSIPRIINFSVIARFSGIINHLDINLESKYIQSIQNFAEDYKSSEIKIHYKYNLTNINLIILRSNLRRQTECDPRHYSYINDSLFQLLFFIFNLLNRINHGFFFHQVARTNNHMHVSEKHSKNKSARTHF